MTIYDGDFCTFVNLYPTDASFSAFFATIYVKIIIIENEINLTCCPSKRYWKSKNRKNKKNQI